MAITGDVDPISLIVSFLLFRFAFVNDGTSEVVSGSKSSGKFLHLAEDKPYNLIDFSCFPDRFISGGLLDLFLNVADRE